MGGGDSTPEELSTTSGGGSSSSSSIDLEEGLGWILGLVLTDDLNPIPAANADLLEGGDRVNRVKTNNTGAFVFANLEPGPYEVEVTVGENEPQRQAVEVEAGEAPAELRFTIALEKPVQNVAHHITTQETGYIECDVSGSPCPGFPTTNNKQTFNHTFTGSPVAFLYEMTWTRPVGPPPPPCIPNPTPPPAETCPYNENGQPGWVHRLELMTYVQEIRRFEVSAPPYARIMFNASDLHTSFDEDDSPVEVLVRSFPNGFLKLPGYAYQTRFDLYMTAFYVDEAPAKTLCFALPETCPAAFTPA